MPKPSTSGKDMRTSTKRALWSIILFLFASAGLRPSLRASQKSPRELVIPENESRQGDQFLAGDSVRVDGELVGDLVFGGRSAHITGIVNGDIIACAQDISVAGKVEEDIWVCCQRLLVLGSSDDIRAVSQHLEIAGRVSGSVLWLGQDLQLARGGEIGRSLRFGAQKAALLGRIGGDLGGAADELILEGQIDGDVDVKVRRLIIEDTAMVQGSRAWKKPLLPLVPSCLVGSSRWHRKSRQRSPGS